MAWRYIVNETQGLTFAMTKKLKILVSLPTRENDFQVEQAASAEQMARKLGIILEISYADNDAVNQSTQILKALQRDPATRPDGIVFEPVGRDALPRVSRAARDAGVGWAVLNRAPDYVSELRSGATAPIFTLTSDHVEIGRIQGRQFAALLPNGGCVLYIEGPSQSSSANKRTSGMLETKPSNIRVRPLKARWTQESAQRAVCSWLCLATSKKAEFDLVGAQDDSMAMGARKAFEEMSDKRERDAWLSLPFTGCDGVPKAGQTWVSNGLLAATVHIPPLAGQAIDMLARAIQNGVQPPETSITVSVSIPSLMALAARKP
ncbi:MAG: sugar ABC transporter substrate-binding protein [Candidatus Acidiferrales bacterium]|jgi:ribose transport system substrate-binding protein